MDEALAGRASSQTSNANDDGANTIVLLQDYQLYLVSTLVLAPLPQAMIEQFMHTPWPANRYWQLLPDRFVHEIDL